MEFTKFVTRLQEHFVEMTKNINILYEVEVDKDELWNLYLDSFPKGTNEIYRKRREYDCSACRQFIKNIGNAVVIKDNTVHTIWEFDTESTTFQPVVNALDKYIKERMVTDVYVSKFNKIGVKENYENTDSGIITFEHLYLELPRKFVDDSYKSVDGIKGTNRCNRNVFKRSLDEISIEAVETVLELIAQNSLYRGEEWKPTLNKFLSYQKEYSKIRNEKEKELYAWETFAKIGPVVSKIRNHSIGTLLINISEGMDLDTAVRKYEQIVAPSNYKRPKAIYTKKMIEDAQKTIESLGFMDSLPRRFAKLDDITVNNILFSNKDAAKKIGGNVFEDMKAEVAVNPKKFSKVDEISIDDFVSNVLPTVNEMEVLFDNDLQSNLVSLIAPINKEAPSMFKWNNGFSWVYNGNIADSMKERVKSFGGKVDGVLRCSIQWNECGEDNSDLDLHCKESDGKEIYFGTYKGQDRYSPCGGNLDVDITQPMTQTKDGIVVENIVYATKDKMKPGIYKFFVHQFNARNSKGFRAEIEFDGNVYSFSYDHPVSGNVVIAEVILDNHGNFTIKEKLPSNKTVREVWGIKTNQFVPVSVMMYSPNYWDNQNGIGNRHYFFMLKDCVNPDTPNGFFNEYLKEDLMQHKRVFEALGGKMAVESSNEQLSGIGFSSTKRNSVVVKVKGYTERVLKINF